MPSGFPSAQPLSQNRSASNRIPNGKIRMSKIPVWSSGDNLLIWRLRTYSYEWCYLECFWRWRTDGKCRASDTATEQWLYDKLCSNNWRCSAISITRSVVCASSLHNGASSLTVQSEFPSLSNTPQQASTSTPSLWASSGARSIAQPASQRPQQPGIMPTTQQTQAQQQTQQQQDDLFSSSSQLPNPQAGFRFGSQTAVGQTQQTAADDFPPLSGNINGDIGQGRTPGLLQGFGSVSGSNGFSGGIGSNSSAQSNGLLNALSSSNRVPPQAAQMSSPTSIGGKSSHKGHQILV